METKPRLFLRLEEVRDMTTKQSDPRFHNGKAGEKSAHRCEDCPYPHHGFICWSRDGSCMRTDVEELTERHWRSKIGR